MLEHSNGREQDKSRGLDRKDRQETDLEEERGNYSLLGEAGAGEGEGDYHVLGEAGEELTYEVPNT